MKKNLLIVAALFASLAATAQTVTWSCKSDGTVADNSAVVTGSETLTAHDATPGAGMECVAAGQKSHKDASGASFNYYDDGSVVTKWCPSSAEAIKLMEDAYTANQYVEFYVEEEDPSKFLTIPEVKFNVVRCGTDAVRINAKLIYGTDSGEKTTDWLITAENWQKVANGDGSWHEGDGEGDAIPGYAPAREKGTDDLDFDGWSKVTLPITNCPADAYEMKLHIVLYGISNTKAMGLGDVTINFTGKPGTEVEGGGESGVSEIRANVTSNAPVYNLAGQRVNSNVKGLLIKNGKKFIQK